MENSGYEETKIITKMHYLRVCLHCLIWFNTIKQHEILRVQTIDSESYD